MGAESKMQTTLRKSLAALLGAIVLSLGLMVSQAWGAEEPSALIDLQDAGHGSVSVTVKDYDKLEDLTTVSLALDISAPSGETAYLDADFVFSSAFDATVRTASVDEINGVLRMNIYIAGNSTELFPLDRSSEGVELGKVQLSIKDTAPEGQLAVASVSVPEGIEAFTGVNTSYVKVVVPEANLRVQDASTVDVSIRTSQLQDSGLLNPGPGAESATNATDGSDIIGKTSETNPNKVEVGDNNMPLIIALVCVVVIAVVVIAVVALRRRKTDDQPHEQPRDQQ